MTVHVKAEASFQASPTVSITIPLPPQLAHIAASGKRPFPWQTGQVFSPVCSVPGAAWSPGFLIDAAGKSGAEGLLMRAPDPVDDQGGFQALGKDKTGNGLDCTIDPRFCPRRSLIVDGFTPRPLAVW
ncbi:hypothetical protein RY831_24475 [Noviherbaspirillum sp. CPCC 100848]|uniref:Uncharacterized protein n=1 Tax=Noviherbaspirillum album TaxID=3080276 RepID=A0ABU6JFK4_9BURK|nr:hypothetical protein [Noviherbaspirillum sp. CPCC 100848]MEC4722323.1 hypothetical protein [Noviherbaspirillum sp. CPCC 100848]